MKEFFFVEDASEQWYSIANLKTTRSTVLILAALGDTMITRSYKVPDFATSTKEKVF